MGNLQADVFAAAHKLFNASSDHLLPLILLKKKNESSAGYQRDSESGEWI